MATALDDTASKAESVVAQFAHDPLLQFAFKIVLGLALLLIGVRVGRWIANIERRMLLRAQVDTILAEFLRNVTYAACIVLLLVSALDLSGFPTATLLTIVGTAGIAIGLALKDSLAHIAAGVILIVLRPFRVGDTVNLAGQEGVVEGVFIFQTRLHSADNREIVLMNSAVVGAPIINYSQHAKRRADVVLHLRADADLKQALKAANEAVADDKRIDTDPAAAITIKDITAAGIALSLQVWCESADLDAVRSDLLTRLHGAMGKYGVALTQESAQVQSKMH